MIHILVIETYLTKKTMKLSSFFCTKVKQEIGTVDRGKWNGKFDFILSILGYAVGKLFDYSFNPLDQWILPSGTF